MATRKPWTYPTQEELAGYIPKVEVFDMAMRVRAKVGEDHLESIRNGSYIFDNEIVRYVGDELKRIKGVKLNETECASWVPSPGTGDCIYKCSRCGFVRDAYLLEVGDYCPQCGAKMVGG